MKFQNRSLNFSLNGRKDERTDGRTHAQAESNMLPTFSKLGGINNFFIFSPINLLIILNQMTKFEAPSCYSIQIS